MKESLFATKSCIIDNEMYFITEDNSIFGNINLNNGEVNLIENVPVNVIGKKLGSGTIVSYERFIILILENGALIYSYNIDDKNFCEINTKKMYENFGGWAGMFTVQDKLLCFDRNDGNVLGYDFIKNESFLDNTGIKEKILWSCKDDKYIYLLSWSLDKIYLYDILTKKITSKSILPDKKFKDNGNKIPMHSMECDEKSIYIMNSKYLIIISKENFSTELLYENKSEDNGCRLAIVNKTILIPPYFDNTFTFLDTTNQKVEQCIEERINKENSKWDGAIAGVISIQSDYCYTLIVGHDFLEVADMKKMSVSTLQLKFDKNNINTLLSKMLAKGEIVRETDLFSVERFLELM